MDLNSDVGCSKVPMAVSTHTGGWTSILRYRQPELRTRRTRVTSTSRAIYKVECRESCSYSQWFSERVSNIHSYVKHGK